MTRAHKIRLNPNQAQTRYFYRAAGIARHAWNWALARYHQLTAIGAPIDWNEIKKEYRALIDSEFPFVREVTKCAAEQAIADLRQAINTYFTVKNNNPKSKIQFPGPRRRSRKIGSFGLNNDQFRLDGKKVWVPRLGWVRLQETLRFAGKIRTGRVKEQAGQWSLVVTVEVEREALDRFTPCGAIGIDFGLARFATFSDGRERETQAYLRRAEKKLKGLQRGLTRKQKGSRNRQRQRRRLAQQRADFQHKFSHEVTRDYALICVEDLNLQGMCRVRNLGKSVADAGIGGTVQKLGYKAEARGGCVQQVGRYFPSSKQCHSCGWVKADLALSEREWQCGNCQTVHDRDVNAAINIKIEGERLHAAGLRRRVACGRNLLWLAIFFGSATRPEEAGSSQVSETCQLLLSLT